MFAQTDFLKCAKLEVEKFHQSNIFIIFTISLSCALFIVMVTPV